MDDDQQRRDALISIVAYRMASSAIREGYMRVCELQDKPVIVTKSELMVGMTRDFRVMKKKRVVEVPIRRSTKSDFEQTEQPSHDTYTSPFLRNFHGKVFSRCFRDLISGGSLLRQLTAIDLMNQRIGDEGIALLTGVIDQYPIETLILTGNLISNEGIKEFAKKWRNYRCLDTLFLNDNKFSDEGLLAMFDDDQFSSTLRKLNISMNTIGTEGAFAIGQMFSSNRNCKLEDVSAGGQVSVHCTVMWSILIELR